MHTAPWIKYFDVKVEVRVMLTDEEFVEKAKIIGLLLKKKRKSRYVERQAYKLINKFYI